MILLSNIFEIWLIWLFPFYATIEPFSQRPPPKPTPDKATRVRDVMAVGQFLVGAQINATTDRLSRVVAKSKTKKVNP